MTTLTVWKFPTADGAAGTLDQLKGLQEQELVEVDDAAIVSWELGKKRPKTKQLIGLTSAGAWDGAFWGALFGLIFFIPLIGAALGAALGALTGSMSDIGIDDDFIASVRDQVTPGTSALFVMTSSAVVDRLEAEFAGNGMQLAASNLSGDQEKALRAAFADED